MHLIEIRFVIFVHVANVGERSHFEIAAWQPLLDDI